MTQKRKIVVIVSLAIVAAVVAIAATIIALTAKQNNSQFASTSVAPITVLSTTALATTPVSSTIPLTTAMPTVAPTTPASVPTLGKDQDEVRKGTPYAVRTNLDKNKPMIAITFDDGPRASLTTQVLDGFRKVNGRGTFFIVGSTLTNESNRKALKQAFGEGHEIGNHSWSHASLTKLPLPQARAEINRTDTAIAAITGVLPNMMRPPYGAYTKSLAKALNKTIAMWSVDTEDWKARNTNIVYNRIMKGAHNGAVILLHDIHPTSVAAFLRAAPELQKKGYQLVTMSELAYYSNTKLNPGDTIAGQ